MWLDALTVPCSCTLLSLLSLSSTVFVAIYPFGSSLIYFTQTNAFSFTYKIEARIYLFGAWFVCVKMPNVLCASERKWSRPTEQREIRRGMFLFDEIDLQYKSSSAFAKWLSVIEFSKMTSAFWRRRKTKTMWIQSAIWTAAGPATFKLHMFHMYSTFLNESHIQMHHEWFHLIRCLQSLPRSRNYAKTHLRAPKAQPISRSNKQTDKGKVKRNGTHNETYRIANCISRDGRRFEVASVSKLPTPSRVPFNS